MNATQLAPLDTSFLAVESGTAHMHVGWVSEFEPPESGELPSFEELRDHIGARLGRAPRYRQRLAEVPLGLSSPSWVDDPDFELERHVVRDRGTELSEVAAEVMSTPLDHERPLWEITIVDGLSNGGLGVIGKAHHCMVDGVAAVELASLLLDPEPDPADPPPDEWRADPSPDAAERLGRGLLSGAGSRLQTVLAPLGVLRSPERLLRLPRGIEAVGRAAIDTVRPARDTDGLNGAELSAERHLGIVSRPLAELREIKDHFEVSLNDVLLATVAGALRAYKLSRDEQPRPLKTMVPVNARAEREEGEAGNRISFMFVDLPCEEPDPLQRLRRLHAETSERKERGLPAASETILDSIGQIPNALRGTVSRLVSGPRFFNLTVSNIPGPPEPMYMCGCRMHSAFPVVPIPERHALSVGMTSIGEQACFGLYADRRAIPDVDEIAAELERELDVLLAAVR